MENKTVQTITGTDVWKIYLFQFNLHGKSLSNFLDVVAACQSELRIIGFKQEYAEIIIGSLVELVLQGRYKEDYIIARVQDVINDVVNWINQGERAV